MVWLAAGVGLATSIGVCGIALLLGKRLGFVDLPDGDLKPHEGTPVPLGGVGVFAGLHIGLAVGGELDPYLLAATSIVFVLGLVDDRVGLAPTTRLIGTLLAGAALAAGESGIWAALATVGLVLVAVNAVNLFDGLDALAASVTIVASAALALMASWEGASVALVVLASALVGFLVFNWPPARMYLGDNGAYVIGVALSWGVGEASGSVASWLVAAALIGMPLVDLIVTIVRRFASRVPLFVGDRDHTYDRMERASGSVRQTVLAFVAMQLVLCGALLLVSRVWAAGIGAGLAVCVAIAALGWGWSGGRRLLQASDSS